MKKTIKSLRKRNWQGRRSPIYTEAELNYLA